jgi:hypothetical protein
MVAVAVHQLAMLLYKDGNLGLHDDWKTWRVPAHLPTIFVHRTFAEHQQYPEGVADVVGYWAENRILGGVALFDRGDLGDEVRSQLPYAAPVFDMPIVLYTVP